MSIEEMELTEAIRYKDQTAGQIPALKHILLEDQIDFPLFYYEKLEQTGMVKHGFTTRAGGVSEGIFSSLNLSFTRGDREEAVRENYRQIGMLAGR